jgi:hypothetical protein
MILYFLMTMISLDGLLPYMSDQERIMILEICPWLSIKISLENYYDYEYYLTCPFRQSIHKVSVSGIYIPEELFRSSLKIQCVLSSDIYNYES